MDEISALMGLGLEEEEQLKALAEQLRGRKQAADFFSATTVAPLREAANREQESVQGATAQAGLLKRALEERRSREEMGRLDRESRERIAAQNNAVRMHTAGMRGASGSPYGFLKTRGERDSFKKKGEDLAKLNAIVGGWKDEYGPSIQLPGVGTVENIAGRFFPTSSSLKEQANWWSQYEDHLAMLKRHELFGSAFTENEKQSWERATITPSTDPVLIKAKLQTMQRLAQIEAEKEALNAYEAGVSPEMIMLHFGNVVDVDELIDMWRNDPEAYKAKREQDDAAAFEFIQTMDEREGRSISEVLDEYAPDAPAQAQPAAAEENFPPHWTEEDKARWRAANG